MKNFFETKEYRVLYIAKLSEQTKLHNHDAKFMRLYFQTVLDSHPTMLSTTDFSSCKIYFYIF